MGDDQLHSETVKARASGAPERFANPDDIILRLRLRSLGELAHVDALLRHFERTAGYGWMRRADERHWHEIREIVSGSVSTHCRGAGDSVSVRQQFDLDARPAVAERCSLCERLRTQRIALAAGFAELVEATEVTHGA